MTGRTAGANLAFRGLTVAYGEMVALRPTDLDIANGEFFALLGPSGSGKSTLLGTVAGFVTPSAGEILLNGTDISSVAPYRRGLGMVFQNYSLFPFMSVAENIAFPLKNRRVPRAEIDARVRRILDTVRLGAFADRMPRQLSGGQQQRVALARAAVYDPPLLLMDEPLGALDKNLREEMQDEIKAFHRQVRATVLYVTHDQYEAAVLADRIGIMNGGRLEQVDTPQRMYERPRNAFVASFLGEANLFPVACVVPGSPHNRIELAGGGHLLAANVAAVSGGDLVACVRPEKIRIGCAPVEADNILSATVEDVVFSAGAYRYRTVTENGQSIVVRPAASNHDAGIAVGTFVHLSFTGADLTLLKR